MVLVRQVVTTVDLLRWQQAVVEAAGPGIGHDFEPGSWTPHVTLARRMRADQVGPALALLTGRTPTAEGGTRVTTARRWDGDARRDWLL